MFCSMDFNDFIPGISSKHQGGERGKKFSFSQYIIQCENKKSWLSFAILLSMHVFIKPNLSKTITQYKK